MATQLPLSTVISRGISEGFNPYSIARLLNAKLSAEGLDEVRPQMMYNYDRNGLIVKGSKGQGLYTQDEVDAFIERTVAKRRSAGKVVKVQTLEDINAEIDRLSALRDEMIANMNADDDVDTEIAE